MTITEPERQLEIREHYGVLVCGGGVAGISAALAAAREGADVLLLEREWLLGGLATLGIVTIYLPLCDGIGKQVSFGIAEELLRLSVKHGAQVGCDAWLESGTDEDKRNRRFQVQFDPNLFALEAEKLLTDNGARILYGTSVCNVQAENGRITHVIAENRSGRFAIGVESVIDATGDAILCRLSGENTALFQQGNVPAGWYYSVKNGRNQLNAVGACDIPDSQKSADKLNADRSSVRFGGTDGKELSELTLLSHKMTLEHFLKNGGDGTPGHALTMLPGIPQIRMTRRLTGLYMMDDDEKHKEFKDSVGLFSDWRKPGPVYELPYSTLVGDKVGNLLTAGRCISVTDAMWDITRVIPVCAVSGQAAGTAAAMGGDMRKTDIPELQKRLQKSGVVLHESQLIGFSF